MYRQKEHRGNEPGRGIVERIRATFVEQVSYGLTGRDRVRVDRLESDVGASAMISSRNLTRTAFVVSRANKGPLREGEIGVVFSEL